MGSAVFGAKAYWSESAGRRRQPPSAEIVRLRGARRRCQGRDASISKACSLNVTLLIAQCTKSLPHLTQRRRAQREFHRPPSTLLRRSGSLVSAIALPSRMLTRRGWIVICSALKDPIPRHRLPCSTTSGHSARGNLLAPSSGGRNDQEGEFQLGVTNGSFGTFLLAEAGRRRGEKATAKV